MSKVQIQEFKSGWVIIVAAVLQYIFGYPATILPMSSILFEPKYEHFKTSETEKAVTIGLFTVFMNIVSVFVGPMVKARSSRFVAICGTSCQVLGRVVICHGSYRYIRVKMFCACSQIYPNIPNIQNISICTQTLPFVVKLVLFTHFYRVIVSLKILSM